MWETDPVGVILGAGVDLPAGSAKFYGVARVEGKCDPYRLRVVGVENGGTMSEVRGESQAGA
jgi:hypothetical protein